MPNKKFDDDESFRKRIAGTSCLAPRRRCDKPRSAWTHLLNVTREHYLPIYERLLVKLTVADERGESAYNNDLPAVVKELKQKGVATESQGAIIIVQTPEYEAPLIIQKSDGGYLYGTTDLAAIRYRVNQLHANRIIYVHDNRQAQHFAQLFWTVRCAHRGPDNVILEYAPFGTMLGEDNKPFKTRSGTTVKLKELLDEAEQRALKVVTDKNPGTSRKPHPEVESLIRLASEP